MTALSFHDVHAAYGPYKALHGVSFAVEDQESVVLVGRNGAGKSTVARVASALVPVSRGTVEVLGAPVGRTTTHQLTRLGVAHLPEGSGLFGGLTVDENVMLRVGGRNAEDRRRRRDVAWSLLPTLVSRRKTFAGNLSGGQQRQVAVAAALASQPRLLIADEPVLGLSPSASDDVYEALSEARTIGCALVIIETRLDRASNLATRAVVMERGRAYFDGPLAEADDRLRRILDGEAN